MCKCSHSSHGAQQELDEVVNSEVFLVWAILTLPVHHPEYQDHCHSLGIAWYSGWWTGLKFYTSLTSWLKVIVIELSMVFKLFGICGTMGPDL